MTDTPSDPRLVAALQEIANLAANRALESFQLRQRIAELEAGAPAPEPDEGAGQ